MTGVRLSACAALAFLGLGAGSLVAPRALARNYGLPVDAPDQIAYLRALGARDAVLGLLIASFASGRTPAPLAATLALSALVGAADFALVLGARGRSAAPNLLVHGGGAIGLLALAAIVRAGR